MSDQLPPHDQAAELALLGCIMLDPKQVLNEIRGSVSDPEEFFYDNRHAFIFSAICELADENIPVDVVTVQNRLQEMGRLESVGGAHFLISLPDATPSAANFEYYATIVGEKASLRRLIRASQKAIQAAYECAADAETIISQTEREILAARQQRKAKTPPTSQLVVEAIDEIQRLYERQGALGGIPTGLADLDRATDGLHQDEMIVIAGFPGGGKSALAMNIAEHAALESDIPVGVFSLEMGAKRLLMRMIASNGRVNMRSIRDGSLTAGDFPKIIKAGGKLKNSKMHFCDLNDLTISQLRAKARQMVQQHGIKLFIVDYLQLLTAPGKKDQNREQEVSAISRGIKQMACEFSVPVLALSQLNEDGKLRESRAIGQDADCVWRIKPNDEATEYRGAHPMQIEIVKQRDGEAPKLIDVVFFKQFTRFENAAREMPNYDKD